MPEDARSPCLLLLYALTVNWGHVTQLPLNLISERITDAPCMKVEQRLYIQGLLHFRGFVSHKLSGLKGGTVEGGDLIPARS